MDDSSKSGWQRFVKYVEVPQDTDAAYKVRMIFICSSVDVFC